MIPYVPENTLASILTNKYCVQKCPITVLTWPDHSLVTIQDLTNSVIYTRQANAQSITSSVF